MILLLLLLLSFQAFAAVSQHGWGWCEQGGQAVVTPGSQNSTTQVQRSYPACTVTVYATGTTTLSTIYSDTSSTPLANPFTASSTGYWSFFADAGIYDVKLSGGGISTPFTITSATIPYTAGGGAGTVTNVTGANGLTGTVTTSGNISGVNAAADGSTKGVSTYTAADFNASSGLISLDYTNGQKATGSVPGFLSAADWTTFNSKQAALGYTAENTANKDAASGYAGLTAGSLLKTAEFPAFTGDVTTSAGAVATTIGAGKVTNAMLAGSIDLTTKVTGTLPVTNGGTGAATETAHGVLLGQGASAVTSVVCASGAILVGAGASADPACSATPTLGLAGTTAGKLKLSGATSGLVTIQPALVAGTWTMQLPANAGTSGYLLTTDGSGVTSWAAPSGSAFSSITSGTNSTATMTVGTGATLTVSGSGVNNANQFKGNSAVAVADGGTGQTTANAGFNALSPMTTAGDVIYGGTAGAGTRLAAGSSTQVLHSGTTPSWSAVSLSADVTGTLPIGNGGTGVTSAADDTTLVSNGSAWQAKALPNCTDTGGQHLNYTTSSNAFSCGTSGGGSVTSVGGSFTGGLISVAGSPVTSSGTLAFTVAGTSGGVPYFTSGSTWASSSALTANLPVIGGGAGSPPTVGTRSGNTTKFSTVTGTLTSGDCASWDASGNLVSNGSPCGSGGSGTVNSGTAGNMAYYSASTNAVDPNANANMSNGALTLGQAGSVIGQLKVAGNTSGTVTVTPAAAAGTWTLTLPTGGGTNGYFLQTNGSGTTTWASASGGGGSISDTYANIIGTTCNGGNSGQIGVPTNSPYQTLRCNGSSWDHFINGIQLTPPVDGDYAWVNQGSATTTTTNGGVTLYVPASGSQNYRLRKKAAPATPYTIEAAFLPNFMGANYALTGVLFRESSSGKMHSFHFIYAGNWIYESSTWNSATSAGSPYEANYGMQGGLIWFQISDNGTNRIVRSSRDGINWIDYAAVGRTNFLTADEVGFGADCNGCGYPIYMDLVHWKEF